VIKIKAATLTIRRKMSQNADWATLTAESIENEGICIHP